MANLEKPIGGRFLKVAATGVAADVSQQGAILKFHLATETVGDFTAAIDSAVKFKKLALILSDAGADAAESYVYVINLGAADAHDNIVVGDISGVTAKTIVNMDITGTIADGTTAGAVVDIIMTGVCTVGGVAYTNINDYFVKNSRTLRISKGIHGNIETITAIDLALAAKPAWSGSLSTDYSAGSYTAKTMLPGGDYDNHIETCLPATIAPAAATTYYFNANHTHIAYGKGNTSLLTYGDGTTGKIFTDEHQNNIYIRCEIPTADDVTLMVQNADSPNDSVDAKDSPLYDTYAQLRKVVGSLRGSRIFMVDKNANITVNGSAKTDYNSPSGDGLLESKFFDALKNDGLFPGALPSNFNNQFMAIGDNLGPSEVTATQVDAGTFEVASTAPGTNMHKHVDTNRKVKFAESTKSFITLDLPNKSHSQVISK